MNFTAKSLPESSPAKTYGRLAFISCLLQPRPHGSGGVPPDGRADKNGVAVRNAGEGERSFDFRTGIFPLRVSFMKTDFVL